MEQSNPVVSVSPEEFQDMQKRLKALEDEKKTWTKRHEAIWALRDEDVENNIKIRVSYDPAQLQSRISSNIASGHACQSST
jgi:hypothetical protein